MKASICYLTWNRFLYTKESLQSIIENTKREDYELILWDNGSTEEGMLDYLRNICKENNFKYLFFKKNQGLTRAMNNQMKIMNESGNFDVFCHIANDIVVPQKWLDGVFEAIKNSKVGVIGLNLEEDYNFEIEEFENIKLEKIRENGNVGGMHYCISKRIFNLLGYFRHVNLGYGQQDANHSLQVKLLPDNTWCYYLPIKEYHGIDLSSTKRIYEEYQNIMFQRLKQSGSDQNAGRNYRQFLKNQRLKYDQKKITAEELIKLLKDDQIFLDLDRSQLLESNII